MSLSSHPCEIVKIKLLPCPNADSLSIVNVFDAYQCVVRTQDWKDESLAVYIPPDSLVDTTLPEFSFLHKNKQWERITIRKFRGNISFGLLIPAPKDSVEGQDVATELNILHYEPPVIENSRMKLGGRQVSGPKTYAPIYKVENLRRYKNVFVEDEPIFVTEKIHGCLKYNVPITMADGTFLPINEIVNKNLVESYVLGMNENGEIVPSKILNVFMNGETKFWMKIQSTLKSGNFSVVDCTPNHKFWLPRQKKYKTAEDLEIGDIVVSVRKHESFYLEEREITSVSYYEKIQQKFDIETETHNYFADNILVHNSSARYVYTNDEMFVGTHRTWQNLESDSVFTRILKDYPEVKEFCQQNPDIVVYGEVYGRIQNLQYGSPPDTVYFSCFDILKEGKWMNAHEAREFGKHLPWVPHIKEIEKFNFEMLCEEVEKDSIVSTCAKGHIREGFVIKPVIERLDTRIGRVNLKFVSNRYLSLK